MNEKILIVDDEKSIVESLTYAFRREGYNVEAASNGKEALEKISVFQPEIIISDIVMPVMNGLDLCKQVGSKYGMGIILLTVRDDIIDRLLGLEFGADDYITKPFDIRDLLARTRLLLQRLKKEMKVNKKNIDM